MQIFSYLKNTSIIKMIVQGCIMLFVATGLSISYLSTMHFDYLIERWEEVSDPNKEIIKLQENLEQTIRINILLENLLKEIRGSSRTYLYQFHNGKSSVNGTSFLYQSKTHEYVEPGISSEITHNQNMPLSLFPRKIQNYLDRKCFSYSINDYRYSEYLLSEGTQEVLTCPVVDDRDLLIGYLGVDFVKTEKAQSEEEIYQILRKASKSLTSYVSNGK